MLHKNQVLTLIFLFILISLNLNAQSVGININSHESAALHIESTSKGILIPAMNSAERENILNPKKGLLVYDLSTASFWFFKGAEWEELNSGDGTFVNNNGIIHNSGDINNDHFVFGADELPDRVTSDTLFMFNKAKGAFRTGSILSSLNWDDSRVGQNSFGAVHNTEASGNNSILEISVLESITLRIS
jgi:hypothetical protein